MKIGRKLLSGLTEGLHMPLEYAAGMPCIELSGLRRLTVRQHRGLAVYSAQEVVIRSSDAEIRVLGSGLTLEAMNLRELTLRGDVFSVEIRR